MIPAHKTPSYHHEDPQNMSISKYDRFSRRNVFQKKSLNLDVYFSTKKRKMVATVVIYGHLDEHEYTKVGVKG
jgi:hypothetical protein